MVADARLITLVLLMAGAGCASSSTWSAATVRPATDTPPVFLTVDGSVPASGCSSPLVDPRDDSRLRLMRSSSRGSVHLGDYEVPTGRYGVRGGELLRIDCGTGQPLGVVAG